MWLPAVCALSLTPEVVENPVNDHRVLDSGNDLHRTATLLTGLEIDPEHAFESLRPRHGTLLFRRSLVIRKICRKRNGLVKIDDRDKILD